MKKLKWDRHFLNLAMQHSKMSKDPSTRVGAVIVGDSQQLLSAGFNGFPFGIKDTGDRLYNRDIKLKLVIHAEMNAIVLAARTGISLEGSTMYMVATSDGDYWGGCPCTRCTVHLIQAGIKEIVTLPFKMGKSNWLEDIKFAKSLMDEAGVKVTELDKDILDGV